MSVFLVGQDLPQPRLQALASAFAQAGIDPEPLRTLDDVPAGEGTRAVVVLPDLSPGGEGAAEALRFAGERNGEAFVLLVADTIAPDLYKALVRGGLGDWVAWGGLASELPAVLRAADAAPGRAAGAGSRIVTFLASKGGSGNTTLALETAVQLAGRGRRGGKRVAILDLDLAGGTLADCLDVEPRLDMAEIAGRPERLDEQLIDVFTSRVSPRLDVFASPVGRGATDIDPQAIFAFLDAIAPRYGIVVLDLPARAPPWAATVVSGSDAVVLTGGGTMPAVRQLVARLSELGTAGLRPQTLAIAVNGCPTNLLGRSRLPGEVARTLSGHALFPVRRDAALESAQTLGRPLAEAAPSSRTTKEIGALAAWIEATLGLEASRAVRKGRT